MINKMTNIVWAVIDNHTKRKGTQYKFLYKTKDFIMFKKYIIEKGLVSKWD